MRNEDKKTRNFSTLYIHNTQLSRSINDEIDRCVFHERENKPIYYIVSKKKRGRNRILIPDKYIKIWL